MTENGDVDNSNTNVCISVRDLSIKSQISGFVLKIYVIPK